MSFFCAEAEGDTNKINKAKGSLSVARLLSHTCILSQFLSLAAYVSRYFKDPHLIDDPRLRNDIQECLEVDEYASPGGDLIKKFCGLHARSHAHTHTHNLSLSLYPCSLRAPFSLFALISSFFLFLFVATFYFLFYASLSLNHVVPPHRLVGLEYEHYLHEQLLCRGIAFKTEEDLRGEGATKTPDVLLTVPIGQSAFRFLSVAYLCSLPLSLSILCSLLLPTTLVLLLSLLFLSLPVPYHICCFHLLLFFSHTHTISLSWSQSSKIALSNGLTRKPCLVMRAPTP